MSSLTPANVGVVGLWSFLLSALLCISCVTVFDPRQPRGFFVPYATLSTALFTVVFLFVYMYPSSDPVTWITTLLLSRQSGLQVLWYGAMGAFLSTSVHLITLKVDIHVAVKRKLYHVALFVLFFPTLTSDLLPVTILCSLVGTCIFLVLEILRWESVKNKQRDILGEYWSKWLDDKDRVGGGHQVVISPITLLVSPVIPALVSQDLSTTLRVIGLIVICVGDTLAAAIGVRFGSHRLPWNGGSKRTVEGSLACFLSVLLSVGLVKMKEGGGGLSLKDVAAAGVVAGVEAGTSCIDNIVLPVVAAIAWKM
jgi:dolichol kinase